MSGISVRTAPGGRSAKIDLLKGISMLGVMVQHAFVAGLLQSSWEILYAGQAVPAFLILSGMNPTRSLRGAGAATLRSLYGRRYLERRWRRLLVPFLVIWPVALLVGVACHQAHLGPLILIGVLPLRSGPGNYYITILFELIVLAPPLYWCFARRPGTTSVVLLALDVGFELAAPHVRFFADSGFGIYVYEAVILKYAGPLLLGLWLWRAPQRRAWLVGLLVGAGAGAVYLVLLHQHPAWFNWLQPTYSRSTNFATALYAALLVVALLRVLPERERAVWAPLAELGRASYHVFLVQIVWFGVISDRSDLVGLLGIAACCALGIGFYRIDTRFAAGAPGIACPGEIALRPVELTGHAPEGAHPIGGLAPLALRPAQPSNAA